MKKEKKVKKEKEKKSKSKKSSKKSKEPVEESPKPQGIKLKIKFGGAKSSTSRYECICQTSQCIASDWLGEGESPYQVSLRWHFPEAFLILRRM